MVLRTILVGEKWERVDDGWDTIDEHIASVLQHWHEDDTDPQTFIVVNDEMSVLVIITRHPTDPNYATAFFPDGRSILWKVQYLMGEDGRYESTLIELVKERSPW